MAANQNIQDRLAGMGITSGFAVGTKAITFSGTFSDAQLSEIERVGDAQGYVRSLAAGVFTLTSRS